MRSLLSVAVLAALLAAPVAISDAAWCHQQTNTSGPANTLPIWNGTPTFVRRVELSATARGELYSVGDGDDSIHLVHLYADTAYDWGLVHGTLMKKEMNAVIDDFWNFLYTNIDDIVNKTTHPLHIFLPDWAINDVATLGIDAVLDLQNAFAKPSMPQSFYDEIKGMADATGYSYDKIVRLFAIPELTRGRCSFIGSHFPASKNTLQLRALDWTMGTGLENSPQVTIYHPGKPSLGFPFANIGWTGISFTLTGMSSQGHGISEIGISYPTMPAVPGYPPSPSFGDETSIGLPFVWLERKLIQFAANLTDGVDMIQNRTNRTCRLVLGMADDREKKAVLVQYAHSDPKFWYADEEQQPPFAPWHPKVGNGIIYLFMDYNCPHFNQVGSEQLRRLYGHLTAEKIALEVAPVVQTGDLHLAVMDHTDGVIITANARGAGETGPKNAYERQFVRIDAKASFAKKYGQNY
jgi:isopenicillin-N N-acyltransferase-like protein